MLYIYIKEALNQSPMVLILNFGHAYIRVAVEAAVWAIIAWDL